MSSWEQILISINIQIEIVGGVGNLFFLLGGIEIATIFC